MHNTFQKWLHGGALCKGYYWNTLTGIKAADIFTDKPFTIYLENYSKTLSPLFHFFKNFRSILTELYYYLFYQITGIVEISAHGRNLSTVPRIK